MNKLRVMYIDILCFIVGPFLITYNLFNFMSGPATRPHILGDIDALPRAYYYYYTDTSQILIALGVVLVCWGFLRIYWKKNE